MVSNLDALPVSVARLHGVRSGLCARALARSCAALFIRPQAHSCFRIPRDFWFFPGLRTAKFEERDPSTVSCVYQPPKASTWRKKASSAGCGRSVRRERPEYCKPRWLRKVIAKPSKLTRSIVSISQLSVDYVTDNVPVISPFLSLVVLCRVTQPA